MKCYKINKAGSRLCRIESNNADKVLSKVYDNSEIQIWNFEPICMLQHSALYWKLEQGLHKYFLIFLKRISGTIYVKSLC